MNYTVITDEKKLDDFIDFLPDLQENEKFYVCLFGRSKYCKGISRIKTDKQQLKRVVCDKKNLKTKLNQMECEIGSYVQYKNDKPDISVPQEALAVYITVNPRDLKKATKNSLIKFVDMVTNNPTHSFNPSNFAMSEIQRSKAKNQPYFILDIDNKNIDLSFINECIGNTKYSVLETRGGYHVLIHLRTLDNSKRKTWYNDLKKHLGDDLDQSGDIMIPIAGTYQGGHTPTFIKL